MNEKMEKIKQYELSNQDVALIQQLIAHNESVNIALQVRTGEALLKLAEKFEDN